MVTPRHRQRSLRPSLRAHGKDEVKGSLEHELIGTKAREGLTPNPHTTPRGEMTGDGEFLEFVDCGALVALDVG
jgi:hypothetical protein